MNKAHLAQDLENQNHNDLENFNQAQAHANPYNPDHLFGPIELNILERVEQGLNQSNSNQSNSLSQISSKNNEKNKYTGPKEVIFVSGWVNIESIYNKYLFSFISKMFIGIFILYSITHNSHNFYPVAICLMIISFFHLVKNCYNFFCYRNSNFKIKIVFIVELNIFLGYFIYFLGFTLVLLNIIQTKYLLLFSFYYLLVATFIFFYNDTENLYLNQKKLSILEAIQLCLISFKFSKADFLNWNYTLIFFMCVGVYLLVLGILMSIILSCSLFGFLYRDIEIWKVKALIWMTWYYLTTGLVFIYLIKGSVIFFNDNDFFEEKNFENYNGYKSESFDVLVMSSILLILFSLINLIFHIIWKNEIKKYLSKVIYKDELRKEISLRFLTKSFTFKLIQISTTYFMKSDKAIENEKKSEEEKTVKKNLKNDFILKKENENKKIELLSESKNDEKNEKSIKSKNSIKSKKSSAYENELCVFCYEDEPNVMIDPCGHGGICKKCVIKYLKEGDNICPFCKGCMRKVFVLHFDKDKQQLFAKGEIKLES